jgi:hypothetical protein
MQCSGGLLGKKLIVLSNLRTIIFGSNNVLPNALLYIRQCQGVWLHGIYETQDFFWYICQEEYNSLPHLSVCTMSLFIGNIVLLKECYRLLEVLHPNITLTVTEIVSKFQIQSFIRQSTLYTCID